MFIPIDDAPKPEPIEGYTYTNIHGSVERVRIIDLVVVQIEESSNDNRIWVEDIPKLIKALNAAYMYVKESKQ